MQHPRSSDFHDDGSLERTAIPFLAPESPRPSLRRVFAAIVWVASLPARFLAIRRDMAFLGAMDDRELADIGLRRQDLRDATALPIGKTPGTLLQRRVDERRRPRRPRTSHCDR